MRFPVNRRCPITDEEHLRVLTYVPAQVIGAANRTYRSNYLETLKFHLKTNFQSSRAVPGFFSLAGFRPKFFLRRSMNKSSIILKQ
jgi:hypothetical protein